MVKNQRRQCQCAWGMRSAMTQDKLTAASGSFSIVFYSLECGPETDQQNSGETLSLCLVSHIPVWVLSYP